MRCSHLRKTLWPNNAAFRPHKSQFMCLKFGH